MAPIHDQLQERFVQDTGFPCTDVPNPDYDEALQREWFAQAIAFWSRQRPDLGALRAAGKTTARHYTTANICSVMLVDLGRDLFQRSDEFQRRVRVHYNDLMRDATLPHPPSKS